MYADYDLRRRDGVRVVWRGVDYGDEAVHPDARAASGLSFVEARIAVWLNGSQVRSIESAYSGRRWNKRGRRWEAVVGYWAMMEDDAALVELSDVVRVEVQITPSETPTNEGV